jgi:arylsulfatase A-like enzyme
MPEHPFDLNGVGERDEYLAEFPRQPDESRMHEADYYSMITHLDDGLGRMHDVVEQAGLLDNTIIVHTADHGLALCRHGLMGKQSVYDHSIRVPLIAAGPGFEQGVDDDRLCYQHDLFPTLLERGGVGGVNSDYAHLQSSTRRTALHCTYGVKMRSIRDERLKLIEYRLASAKVTQLFDTLEAPDECRDLSGLAEFQSDLQRLRVDLQNHVQQTGDPWGAVEL